MKVDYFFFLRQLLLSHLLKMVLEQI